MYCPKCGCEYQDGYYHCPDCNIDLIIEEPVIESIYPSSFKRLCALLIDLLILTILTAPFGVGFILWLLYEGESINPFLISLVSSLLEIIPYWLYFSLFESSKFKGSIGKIIFKIIVVTDKGERLFFKKATIRCFSKIISFMLGLIGLIIMLLSEKKMAIHDSISGTLVLKAGYEYDMLY